MISRNAQDGAYRRPGKCWRVSLSGKDGGVQARITGSHFVDRMVASQNGLDGD